MDPVAIVGNINIPVWLYRILAIFPLTGMAGIDHFAIGSNQTGMAKALINIITFGSWYVFDALQSLNGPKVVQDGLEIPFYGHAEIGKGKITEGVGFGSGMNFLNLLFTLTALLFYILGEYFSNVPGAIGDVAKVVKGVSLPATIGIGGYTITNAFKKSPPAGGGAPAAPVAQGQLPQGLPQGLPQSIPSIDSLAKMVGGGSLQEQKESSPDVFILGTLFVLAACGFMLANVRSKEL